MKTYAFTLLAALALSACTDKEKEENQSLSEVMIDRGPKEQPAGVTLHARLFEQQTFGNLIVTSLKLIRATPDESRSEEFQTTAGVVRVYVEQFQDARREIAAQYEMVSKDAATHPDRLKAIKYLVGDLDAISVRIGDLEHVLPR